MARSAGFEPTTPAFGGLYSIQLSYERVLRIFARNPGRVRLRRVMRASSEPAFRCRIMEFAAQDDSSLLWRMP